MNNWFGEFPSTWKFERLENYIYEINEKNNPIKTDNILSLTNKLGVVPYSEKGNQGNTAKESLDEYKIAYPNTIVCNCMNVLIGSVGISNYYGCVSPVYYVFKTKDNANLEFINYIFQTTEFQKELRRYANGILEIRLRVSSSNILKRRVPIPTLEEQNKIVEVIKSKEEKISALIKNEEAQIEKLKAYKQALISEVVTKGLVPNVPMKDSGIEWIGEIPESWNICRLRDLGNCQNGINKDSSYFGSGFRFLNYKDVYDNYQLPTEFSGLIQSTIAEQNTYSIKKGDIFFTRTSETIQEIAFSSVAYADYKNACFSSFLIRFRPYNLIDMDLSYAKYYFRSNVHRNYFVKEMNIVTRCSLSQNLLKNLIVLMPPLIEQIKIGEFLDHLSKNILKLIYCKNKKIEFLKQYRQSMIYEYVTGKREVD